MLGCSGGRVLRRTTTMRCPGPACSARAGASWVQDMGAPRGQRPPAQLLPGLPGRQARAAGWHRQDLSALQRSGQRPGAWPAACASSIQQWPDARRPFRWDCALRQCADGPAMQRCGAGCHQVCLASCMAADILDSCRKPLWRPAAWHRLRAGRHAGP